MFALDPGLPATIAPGKRPRTTLTPTLALRDGVFGAAADPTFLARLSLQIGDRVTIGAATFEIRSAVEAEPDKLAGGIGFALALLMSRPARRPPPRWRYYG
jgi:putative ABC transport system permease protein